MGRALCTAHGASPHGSVPDLDSRLTGLSARAGLSPDGPFARTNVPWLLAAAVLSLVLRIPFFALPMIADEGGYAYVAQRWLDGRGQLYHEIWVSRPQGIFLAYGAIMESIGTSPTAFRIGAWLVAAAMIPFVWAIGARCGGRTVAIVGVLLYAVIAGSPAIEGFTANAEVFMALPAIVALWLLLRAQERGWGAGTLLAIGALASIATLMKPSGIVMFPVALAGVCLLSDAAAGTLARRGGWVLAGGALGMAPALIHGYLVGWDAFVFAALTYRISHQSSLTAGPERHLLGIGGLLLRSLPMLAALVLAWQLGRRGSLTPAVSGGAHDLRRDALSRVRAYGRRNPALLALWLWSGGCLAGIAMGGDWWNHYLIQIAAPVAIVLALLVVDAGRRLAGTRRIAFAAVISLLLVGPYGIAFAGNPEAISDVLYPQQDLGPQDEVATYLRTHGDPDATILIAFDKAAVYYLADRPAAYRYLYDQELRAIPGAEDALIAIVSGDARPEYVIDTLQPSPFANDAARFWAAVDQHYAIETEVDGWVLYRAR
jgi:4-amino-4-deoxy-L-arabinose transferase-like glycosyltransferase